MSVERTSSAGDRTIVAKLGAGAYFGERSLIKDEVRCAAPPATRLEGALAICMLVCVHAICVIASSMQSSLPIGGALPQGTAQEISYCRASCASHRPCWASLDPEAPRPCENLMASNLPIYATAQAAPGRAHKAGAQETLARGGRAADVLAETYTVCHFPI